MCFFSLKTCPIFNLPYVLMCRLGSKADLLVGQSLYYRMDINHICLYRLVSLMKYTKYIFIAAISVILICVALFIKTIPIYPSFQKNCSTLSEIQKNFTGCRIFHGVCKCVIQFQDHFAGFSTVSYDHCIAFMILNS